MKSKILIAFVLFYSCRNSKSYVYDIDNRFYADNIKYYLYQDGLLIDSSKYYTNVYLITEAAPYQALNIDICEKGWSCRSYIELVNFNKIYLEGRFNYENKFLNKIIEAENLNLSDSIKILNYWKVLNSVELKISNDPNWNGIVDLFYDNFVFNPRDSSGCYSRLDQCEIQMYKSILDDLKDKKAGFYYATSWLPEFLSKDIGVTYHFDVKRLKFINNNGNVSVEVSAGDFIKFR